jgi:hypothetical protein
MNFIGRRRSLPHTNKGTSRREKEHSLYPWICRLFVEKKRQTNITNMVSINNTSMLMISVSESFLVESEWGFFQNKICPFLTQGICIYVGHSFL